MFSLPVPLSLTTTSSMEESSHREQEEALVRHQIETPQILDDDKDSLLIQREKENTKGDSLPTQVESIIGYEFKNKCLLEEAFTHYSYDINNCSSYERLEYIGDAVLNLLVTKHHFFSYPDLAPGQLTRLRATNVDTEKLARVAIKHNLYRFLRHKKPLARLGKQIQEFAKDVSEYPLHSNGLIDVPKCLADIVEATIGAVFVDCDSSIDEVWKIFKSLLEPIINPNTIQNHPVTELYQICQKKNLKIRFVDMWKESMSFDVVIDENLVGTGTYGGKKEIAHNRAAKNALDNIEKVPNISKSIDEGSLTDMEEALVLHHGDRDSLPNQQEKETSNGGSPLPLNGVESILGYEFKNKCLMKEAFTHNSYDADNCSSCERLEYIGDAVLNLLVAKHHFFSYPNLKPGQLTRLRAISVDTEKLARVAIKHNLHCFLRHKKPLLGKQIQAFTKAISEYPSHSNGLIDVPKSLADIVKSTVGAVFVDCDSTEKVWKIFRSLLEPISDPNTIQNHPITELYQICQKKNLKIQFVDSWKESMRFDVFVNKKLVGSGTYGTKKEIAQNRAAKDALNNIERGLNINKSTNQDELAC